MRYSNDEIYKGNFIDDKRNGDGVLTVNKKYIYDGKWNNDKMHGEGTFTLFKDRRWHKGLWEEGELKKYGKLYWPKNSEYKEYEGEIFEGMMHGSGVLIDK